MNSKLKDLKEKLERAGGSVMFAEDMPDEVAELVVHEIMSCPECAAAIAEAKDSRKRDH